jgi:hypothetical protein
MSDNKSNDKAQANMREKNSTNLNTSGKEGQKVQSPCQDWSVKRSRGHVEVGTNKKS